MNTRRRAFVVLLVTAAAACLLLEPSRGEWRRVQTRKRLTALDPAEQMALLWNWLGARETFRTEERKYAAGHDERNRLRAHIGYLRSNLEFSSVRIVDAELEGILNTPIVQHDPSLTLFALIAKGDCAFQLNLNEAYKTWNAVAQLADQLNDDIWKNRASAELGTIEFYRGNVSKALQLVSSGLAKADSNGDVGAQIRYRAVLGEGFLETQRYADALLCFQRSINLANNTEYASPPFTALLGRARALIALNKENEGLPELRRLLADSRKQGLRVRQTRVLSALSDYFSVNEISNPETAAISTECYTIASKDGLARLSASSAARLAEYYTRAGILTKAEVFARAAVEAAKSSQDVYNLPDSLAALADIQAADGRIVEAARTFREAVARIDDVLSRIPSLDVRNAMLGQLTPIYGRYLNLLVSKLHDDHGAFRLVEQARARSIDDFLIGGPAQQPALNQLFVPKVNSLHWALRKERQHDQRIKLSQELWEVERQATTVKATLPIQQMPLPTVAQVQSALARDETLLTYALAAPQSFLIVITCDSFSVVRLSATAGVQSAIGRLSEAIKNRQPANEVINLLSDALIRHIPKRALRTDISVVPDGNLTALPFELLRDDRDKMLLSTHSVSYAPSVTAWYWLRCHHKSRAPSHQEAFLGVGGVIYDGQQVSPTRAGTSTGSIFSTIDAPVFHQLASSGDEVTAVSKLLNAATADVLVKENATEERIKTLTLAKYTVMHFAVHSTLDYEFPERSALLLGDGRSSSEDGLLQAREIRRLNINAKLVTLSACNTAAGKGDGFATFGNLAQAFLTAGAQAVLATDWAVDDNMTNQLMKAFYGHFRTMTVADALRAAKLDIIRQYDVGDLPYYWAGFRVTGDAKQEFREENNVHSSIGIHDSNRSSYIAAAGRDSAARQ